MRVLICVLGLDSASSYQSIDMGVRHGAKSLLIVSDAFLEGCEGDHCSYFYKCYKLSWLNSEQHGGRALSHSLMRCQVCIIITAWSPSAI